MGGTLYILFTNEQGYEKIIKEKIVSEKLSPTPPITINDFHNVQFIYSTNNGSLPPPHHRESTLTISESTGGLITGKQEVRDYDKVLEKKSFTVSSDQFKDLVNLALALKPSSIDEKGCAGGSSQSVKILKAGKTLLDISADSCGGNPAYQSLAEFSVKINGILHFLDFVDTLENFSTLSPNDISKILNVSLVETTEELNPYYFVREAKGSNIAGFFKSVELRTPTETNKGGLFILDLRDDLGITEKDILKKYPKAIPELAEATAPITVPYDWMVKKPWGKISFQITRDGSKRVVSVILDSID